MRSSSLPARIVVVIAALACLIAAAPVPATATEVQASSARAAVAEALLIGDSVMAGMAQSYGAEARATLAARHSFVLDAVACRRLIGVSCRIGSSPAPTNAITVLRARAGQYNKVLVVAAGYNDSSSQIGPAVDQMVAEANRQGIRRIVWLTYREAGDGAHVAQYRANNAVLRAKDAEYGDLFLADWAGRSRSLPSSWFSGDGLHMGREASTAMADLIADTLDVVLFGAPTAPPPAAPQPTDPPDAPPPPPTAPPVPARCVEGFTGTYPAAVPPATDAAPAGGVHVLTPPARLLDTREGGGGKLGPGRQVQIPVAGTNGVPHDAEAALVTITSVEPCADGFLTAFPCGNGVPTAAVLNAPAGSIVANSAVVRLGGGSICVYANQPADVVVDLTGWIGPAGAGTTVVSPVRLVDTRPGEGQALPVAQQRLGARSLLAIDVAAHPAIGPGATALTFNLAAAAPAADGFLTVLPGPCGSVALPPTTASLTVAARRDTAASATVAVGGGQLCVYSSVETDVVVDLQAVHGPGRASTVVSVSPRRLVDTRSTARLGARVVLPLDLDALMPGAVPAGVDGAVVNLVGVDPTGNGYLVVYGCSLGQPPFVSNLNVAGITVANRALVSTEGGRQLCVFTTAPTDVVIDVEAWIT